MSILPLHNLVDSKTSPSIYLVIRGRKLVKDYFNLIIREPTPTMTTLAHCNVNVTFNKNNNLIHSLVSNQLASVHFEQPVRPPPGQHPKHLPQ